MQDSCGGFCITFLSSAGSDGDSGWEQGPATASNLHMAKVAAEFRRAAVQVVGDQFGMGIDDTHMKIRGAPVLDEPALSPHQKMIADKLAVSELMSMAVVALPPIVKVCPV